MNTELQQADLIAKINSAKSYIENLLNQLEKECDKMENDQTIKYNDPNFEYMKGLVKATETIKEFIDILWTNGNQKGSKV